MTACVAHRRQLFGRVVGEDVQLSALGRLVASEIAREASLSTATLPHVVMPDHVHLLVTLGHSAARHQLTTVVRRVKGNVTRQARACALIAMPDPLWQRGFFDRVVRDVDEYDAFLAYIDTNPLRWSLKRQSSEERPRPKGAGAADPSSETKISRGDH